MGRLIWILNLNRKRDRLWVTELVPGFPWCRGDSWGYLPLCHDSDGY